VRLISLRVEVGFWVGSKRAPLYVTFQYRPRCFIRNTKIATMFASHELRESADAGRVSGGGEAMAVIWL
jgi:hypothetical protein